MLPVGTKVTVVNQPTLFRVQDGRLYVQSFPPHEEHAEAKAAAQGQRFNKKLQDKLAQVAKQAGLTVEWPLVQSVVNGAQGIAVPVSQPTFGLDTFLASARLVAEPHSCRRDLGRQRQPGADQVRAAGAGGRHELTVAARAGTASRLELRSGQGGLRARIDIPAHVAIRLPRR